MKKVESEGSAQGDLGKELGLVFRGDRYGDLAGILAAIGRDPRKLRNFHARLRRIRRHFRDEKFEHQPLEDRISLVQSIIRRTRGRARP